MSAQRFSEELQSRLPVPPLHHEAFEHLALVVDSTPEAVLHPIDLHEDLIEVPAPMLMRAHGVDAPPADHGRENHPEPVLPKPHGVMRDLDSALVQKILHVAQRERGTDMQHHRQTDDPGAHLDMPRMRALLIPPAQPPNPQAASRFSSDTAGCGRTFATCRDRFARTVNFGGFPHMPGTDFAMFDPKQGASNDGSKIT